MIFSSLFGHNRVVKKVTVYISKPNSEIIIVPLFQDGKNGIIFEQKKLEKIPFDSSYQMLGEAIKRNFNLFSFNKYTADSGRVSEWPALKASKEKTKVSFEKNYMRVSVSGANEYNIIFNIETTLQDLSELEICSTISAFCDDVELGKRILRIYNSEICEKKL